MIAEQQTTYTVRLETVEVEIFADTPELRAAVGAIVGVAVNDVEDYARALVWAGEVLAEEEVLPVPAER